MLKLARYSDGLRKFGTVLHKSKMQLLTAGKRITTTKLRDTKVDSYQGATDEKTLKKNFDLRLWQKVRGSQVLYDSDCNDIKNIKPQSLMRGFLVRWIYFDVLFASLCQAHLL